MVIQITGQIIQWGLIGTNMKIFYDTEYAWEKLELISIGMVAEDGRELYLQNSDCDLTQVNNWVKHNVVPHLERLDQLVYDVPGREKPWLRLYGIMGKVGDFCGENPEFWGYYSANDHFMLERMIGLMEFWPKTWPMITYDLRQALDDKGLKHITQPDSIHHALYDALWIRDTYYTHIEKRGRCKICGGTNMTADPAGYYIHGRDEYERELLFV